MELLKDIADKYDGVSYADLFQMAAYIHRHRCIGSDMYQKPLQMPADQCDGVNMTCVILLHLHWQKMIAGSC